MENAPKDRPILVLHKNAEAKTEKDFQTCAYFWLKEGIGAPDDGPYVAVWGGEHTEDGGYEGLEPTIEYPNWWYPAFDEAFEQPLLPQGWLPIPVDK
jgi:hypothetical protein